MVFLSASAAMAGVTEARVRAMIEERMIVHEQRLAELLNTADVSVRQVQQESANTQAGLEDSNLRASDHKFLADKNHNSLCHYNCIALYAGYSPS